MRRKASRKPRKSRHYPPEFKADPAGSGPRLGKPADLATTTRFTPATVHRYGRTDTIHIAEIT